MMDSVINVEAIYGADTRKPWVQITWGDMKGLLTPEEARKHALRILACANAAEQDAFMVDFLVNNLDVPLEKAAVLLLEFRDWRVRTNGED